MAENKNFYPCTNKDCRFYGEWEKWWNEKQIVLAITIEGAEKNESNSGYITKLGWCLSCQWFEKQDNFIKKGE